MGERGAEEAKRTSVFSARIVPIPAFGTKRLEIEYHESIPVENLKSYFAIPLRPDAYQAQAARHLRINFELHTAHAIRNFQAPAKSVPSATRAEHARTSVQGHFEGENVNLGEDFVTTYDLDPAGVGHAADSDLPQPGQRPAFADRDCPRPQHQRTWLL